MKVMDTVTPCVSWVFFIVVMSLCLLALLVEIKMFVAFFSAIVPVFFEIIVEAISFIFEASVVFNG
jgi:hypothetical protein